MILVDTSVWVDFLRGEDSSQRRVLHRLIEDEADISITEIIFTEILQGIKNDREFQAIKDYLLEFPMQRPKGIETYLHAVRNLQGLQKEGQDGEKDGRLHHRRHMH